MRYRVEIEDQETGAFSTFQSDDLELAIEEAQVLLTKVPVCYSSSDTD